MSTRLPSASFPTPDRVAQWAREEPALTRSALRSPRFWNALVEPAGLRVGAGSVPVGDRDAWLCTTPAAPSLESARQHLAREGYQSWPDLVRPEPCARLAQGITRLCARGWNAAFVVLLDDAWQLAHHLAAFVGGLLDDRVVFRGELSAFCVDPSLLGGRARGMPPHRDRHDAGTFDRGGLRLPRHCTTWVSLTEATVANGCMRVVPRSSALPPSAMKDERRLDEHARILETRPGTVLLWSGRTLHWGGEFDPTRARGPRVALAISLTDPARPSFGRPGRLAPDRLPSFDERRVMVSTLMRGLHPPAPGSPMDTVLRLMEGQ